MGRHHHSPTPLSADFVRYRGPRKIGFSTQLPTYLHDAATELCEQLDISLSRLFEVLLKDALVRNRSDERTQLREAYSRVTDDMEKMKQRCGLHYEDIRKTFFDLGGAEDGTNAETTFPKLYNHMSSGTKDLTPYIPFFERRVLLTVKHREILKRLKELGSKVEGIESETPGAK